MLESATEEATILRHCYTIAILNSINYGVYMLFLSVKAELNDCRSDVEYCFPPLVCSLNTYLSNVHLANL